MGMQPLEQIAVDRQAARNQDDSNADACFLALSLKESPSLRTLVVRDITDAGLLLFINRTSAKWQVIRQNPQAEALLWYPSVQRQYRVAGKIEELPHSVVESNWQRRPIGSKYLDHAYEQLAAQSSEIESRQHLLDFVARMKGSLDGDSLTAPDNAMAVLLRADTVECLDLNSQDRLHDRNRYSLREGKWHRAVLMP